MPGKPQWATIEGGMAQGFPLSINQSVDWMSLRRGECYAQDQIDAERDGIMRYSVAPVGSSDIFYKEVVRYDTPEDQLGPNQIQGWQWDQKYWIEPEDGEDLVAGPSFGNATSTYPLSGGKIKMVVEIGEWRMMIVKADRAFVFDASEQLMSVPYFGIGTDNDNVLYTNAVWYGNAVLVWKAGGDKFRHFLWDGRGPAVELSRAARDYAGEPSAWIAPTINWSRGLIIIGKLAYDMENRRVLYYSGNTSASLTTRPYFHAHFHPILLTKLAFFCDGKAGSFKATIEYGQSPDRLQKSKTFVVNITANTKTRFRHLWTLDAPVRCRVWRVLITDQTGIGITQIDALSAIDDGPDSWDGDS